MEARRSREKLTPIFMSRQQRREFYHHRGRPPAPSPCEARAGRGAPSIELARLIGIPSPVPSPHSSVVGSGNRPAAWWWYQMRPRRTPCRFPGLSLVLRPPPSGIKVLVQLRLDHLLVTLGTHDVAE